MTVPLVAGNWKMNTTVEEGVELVRALRDNAESLDGVDIAVLPPFTHLWAVRGELFGSGILMGAQDVFWEDRGAYTGEVSPLMLRDICDFVLIGHSERRHVLGESDEVVSRKVAAAARNGMRVMLAVGETQEERDAGDTTKVIDRQLDSALPALNHKGSTSDLVIAYEPVWAIGTGRNATPEQAQEVCQHIGRHIERKGLRDGVRVLYGGSVSAENAAGIFAQEGIDGALVGGASLRSDEFSAIVVAARDAAVA